MHLGHLSISLAVKDLAASRAFYEKLCFAVIGGVAEQNWLILHNGDSTVGLFQGMFERNVLTFNPGWDARAQRLEEFSDVREIQRHLKEHVWSWRPRPTSRPPARRTRRCSTWTATRSCSTSTSTDRVCRGLER